MRILKPVSKPLRGTISVPGDKSISHRALMLGALSRDGIEARGLADGEDVRSTRRCLEALGVPIAGTPEKISVQGRSLSRAAGPLDCGNSGTTMRLLSGILAGQPFESTMIGDASLSRRPMKRVAEPLTALGARVTLSPNGCAPMRVQGRNPLMATTYRLPVASAQVKSCVLLAGLFADGTVTVEDPFHSRDHTERMLKGLSGGKAVTVDGDRISVHPHHLIGGVEMMVPGDISSAAFFLGSSALVDGSRVTVSNVGLNPTRTGFLEALQEMGALIEIDNRREQAGEPVGDVTLSYAPLSGLHLTPERVPALVDEIPMLAVLAASARGESVLEGLGELRVKESDRLEGIAAGLRAMGAKIELVNDGLRIQGPTKFRGAALKTLADHRLAMAFTVASLVADGETTLDDADCVAISFPGFFTALESLKS